MRGRIRPPGTAVTRGWARDAAFPEKRRLLVGGLLLGGVVLVGPLVIGALLGEDVVGHAPLEIHAGAPEQVAHLVSQDPVLGGLRGESRGMVVRDPETLRAWSVDGGRRDERGIHRRGCEGAAVQALGAQHVAFGVGDDGQEGLLGILADGRGHVGRILG